MPTAGQHHDGRPMRPAIVRLSRRLPAPVDAETAFVALFRDEPFAAWLDSSRVEPGLSRFSVLGCPAGRLGEVLSYNARTRRTSVRVMTRKARDEEVEADILTVLERRMRERSLPASAHLPVDFAGGYIGFFGYELRADLGSPVRHPAVTPDAVWMFCTRLVVLDHATDVGYLIALAEADRRASEPAGADLRSARRWMDRASRLLAATLPGAGGPAPARTPMPPIVPERHLARDRERYLGEIERCRWHLRRGDSYEICLTNSVHLPPVADPWQFYRRQRRANPAPYAAFLRLSDLTIASSSPERFLRVDADRMVESKPIKGTAARRPDDPAADEARRRALVDDPKTRAENLMIVDLLRNDLSRVCLAGTVEVPAFLAVESYATLHHLVSTVRGRLRPDRSVVDCVRACFPPGSMTGAPKLRTMEIIDELETEPRGIYSGALGWLGLDGRADLSVVIRTAVLTPRGVTIGAGGAIVLDSDPAQEYAEMLLKLTATLAGELGGGGHGENEPDA